MPLLSVIVPTRNRPRLAAETVRAALRAGGADIEVVVRDCSDARRPLVDALKGAGLWERVVYEWGQGPIAMQENWNAAIALAGGEYLIVIGDDDGILPSAVDVARLALERNCPAIAAERRTTYWHPDFPDAARAGSMQIPAYSGRVVTISEGADAVDLATGDAYGRLPMIYHGIVRRDVLTAIEERSGRFVDGISPDIYSAFAVALTCGWFMRVDFPFSIVGASTGSNTARTLQGKIGESRAEWRELQYSQLAPDSFMTHASNTDSLLRALENLGRLDLARKIDLRRVYARTIYAEPRRAVEHAAKYLKAIRLLGGNRLLALPELAMGLAGKAALQVGRRMLAKSKAQSADASSGDEHLIGIENIEEAVEAQMRWLARHPVRLGG